ncbi:MAG: hypothetical protein E4G95_02325 [Bacteroidia bacterium]|nr:MAG: hypothetical protein E4G95_02325 [Bacteroidia bacterium]
MKTIKAISVVILSLFLAPGCEKAPLPGDQELYDGVYELTSQDAFDLKGKKIMNRKATGSVELDWMAGGKGGDKGNKPEELLAFFEFNAHEAGANGGPNGEIVFRVTEMDFTMHREIRAEVFDVLVKNDENRAWFVAMVVSDTKGCGGNDSGGHEAGCSDGGHTDEEGGCSDDTSHDAGCSHDDTGEGESPGGETGDTGCSDDETDEGGCADSGTDEGHTGEEGSGSPGGTGMGNPLSGKNCRIGQLIAVKVHDVGTPGTAGDGITWKWFSPTADFVPSTENIPLWPHLCKKTIIAGNLVVHY